ncbi:hypothetical protein [Micromonospora marina]|uniref:hypothetical protein n=1 Tax=Micromonospora marina TaxID=307120 RepID=UPI003D70F93E
MGLEGHGFDVRYPMGDSPPRELTARAYARALIERSEVDTSRLGGVLGYCMAGHIAHEVAAQVTAERMAPPALILFDSGPCLAEEIAEECRAALKLFGGEQLSAVLDDRAGPGLLSAECLRDSPDRSVQLVERALHEYAISLYPDAAAYPEEAEETAAPLVDHFIEWLAYLVAAHNTVTPAWSGHVLHLISRGHSHRDEWPGVASTTTRVVDCDRNSLLAAAEARDLVIAHIQVGVSDVGHR